MHVLRLVRYYLVGVIVSYFYSLFVNISLNLSFLFLMPFEIRLRYQTEESFCWDTAICSSLYNF